MFLLKNAFYLRKLKLSRSKEKYIYFYGKTRIQIGAFASGRSRSGKPSKSAVMYLCARGIKCASFYAFYIGFLNCSNRVFFFTLVHILTFSVGAKHQSINQSINQLTFCMLLVFIYECCFLMRIMVYAMLYNRYNQT